jgi:hypothetical protein
MDAEELAKLAQPDIHLGRLPVNAQLSAYTNVAVLHHGADRPLRAQPMPPKQPAVQPPQRSSRGHA